jgi:protein-L-isoaspartate(D-aspartate) O-methyltransferase
MIDSSSWDIRDERVLDVMRSVPRRNFVPEAERDVSEGDFPLPIGFGQTISQPYIVAYMTEKLVIGKNHKILEIGTGSGYQTAVLAGLAGNVYSVERIPDLAERAAGVLADLGYVNVRLKTGNGREGWPEYAPYDRIIVTAAPAEIPRRLLKQLSPGGRMLLPVGPPGGVQFLVLVSALEEGSFSTRRLLPVRFVPLI